MELKLQKTQHPNFKDHGIRFKNLIGLDDSKSELLITMKMILKENLIENWEKKHHKEPLTFLMKGLKLSPLIILSGEVGCGKTELAQTIGTPLASLLDTMVISLQTPSDIRGVGLVGQLSARITAAFTQAKSEIKKGCGILIIDEADDIATNRDQTQAHHEDKAGVNALIKEIDSIEKENVNMVVLLITNRMSSLDPAVIRRACLHVKFKRPGKNELPKIFNTILDGARVSDAEIEELTEVALSKPTSFSYSDLFQRVAKQALLKAIENDKPFNSKILLEILKKTEPTPLIIDEKKHD
jgi:SpoVK/Ycf46/Vps4 family AAA+-type ATPase